MKKTRRIYLVLLAAMLIPAQQSCELIDQSTTGLTNDEIIQGLKTALTVGTDSSVFITSQANGYYKDKLIKIALPEEANNMITTINYIDKIPKLGALINSTIDLKGMVSKTELSLNRAAESAAKTAAPIFKKSITDLSITNALNILQGKSTNKSTAGFDSIAATNYLRNTTYDQLVVSYSKPVDSVLNVPISEIGFTPNTAWTTLVSNYNVVVGYAQTLLNTPGISLIIPADQITMLKQFKPVTEATLGQYVTKRALDGLFIKVGDQERSIRQNPAKWISNTLNDIGSILQKVFGGSN